MKIRIYITVLFTLFLIFLTNCKNKKYSSLELSFEDSTNYSNSFQINKSESMRYSLEILQRDSSLYDDIIIVENPDYDLRKIGGEIWNNEHLNSFSNLQNRQSVLGYFKNNLSDTLLANFNIDTIKIYLDSILSAQKKFIDIHNSRTSIFDDMNFHFRWHFKGGASKTVYLYQSSYIDPIIYELQKCEEWKNKDLYDSIDNKLHGLTKQIIDKFKGLEFKDSYLPTMSLKILSYFISVRSKHHNELLEMNLFVKNNINFFTQSKGKYAVDLLLFFAQLNAYSYEQDLSIDKEEYLKYANFFYLESIKRSPLSLKPKIYAELAFLIRQTNTTDIKVLNESLNLCQNGIEDYFYNLDYNYLNKDEINYIFEITQTALTANRALYNISPESIKDSLDAKLIQLITLEKEMINLLGESLIYPHHLAHHYNGCGIICDLYGDYNLAIKYYAKSLNYYHKSSTEWLYYNNINNIVMNIPLTLFKLNNTEKADSLYKYISINGIMYEQTMVFLSGRYHSSGETNKEISILKEILSKTKMRDWKKYCYLQLGKLYTQNGDFTSLIFIKDSIDYYANIESNYYSQPYTISTLQNARIENSNLELNANNKVLLNKNSDLENSAKELQSKLNTKNKTLIRLQLKINIANRILKNKTDSIGTLDSLYSSLRIEKARADSAVLRERKGKEMESIAKIEAINSEREAQKLSSQLTQVLGIAFILLFLAVWLFFNARSAKRKAYDQKIIAENLRIQAEKEKSISEELALISEFKSKIWQEFGHIPSSTIASTYGKLEEIVRDKELLTPLIHLERFLSNMFRNLRLGNDERGVEIKDELSLAEEFINYRNLIWDTNITFIKPKFIPEFKIPPAILLSTVKNAIEHGKLKTINNGIIKINISQNKEYYECTILDNGIGFPEEVKTIQDIKKGTGLKNVNSILEFFNKNSHHDSNVIFGKTNEMGFNNRVTFKINIV